MKVNPSNVFRIIDMQLSKFPLTTKDGKSYFVDIAIKAIDGPEATPQEFVLRLPPGQAAALHSALAKMDLPVPQVIQTPTQTRQ